jgi:hypothetical protein
LPPGIDEDVRAHEQDTARLQALEAEQQQIDGRWPVPYAIMLIAVVSVALWSLILGVAGWVTG